jgi:RHS repeat-associated protein
MTTCNRWLSLSGALALGALFAQHMDAQIGNDNPTGPSGSFNGNVTTGCSYDPYTGNARRSVTDIVVAGSVGAYPLAFSRVANSRGNQAPETYHQFGEAGWWRHSYSWRLEDSYGGGQPTQYVVDFPDGRYEGFTASPSDTCFRSGPGLRERFQPLDLNTMLAYLILPDGGKVEFTAARFYSQYTNQWLGYTYQATGIIDPYGQRTTLTYNGDGGLNTIQEPGGRWLQLLYVPAPVPQWGNSVPVIDHVQASDGRVVQYNYGAAQFAQGSFTYNYLANVVYPADPGLPPPTAYYTYQGPNVPDYEGYYSGYPLLAGCDDPMYAGPMKKISYTYGTRNPDSTFVGYGQILSENSGTTGQPVSTLIVDSNTSDTRTEIRGDGPSRTFNYIGGKLVNYTDFKAQPSYISYDANGFTSAFTDPRGKTTTFLREGVVGAMSVLTHPEDHSTQGYAYWYANGGPYYVQIRGDERGHNTYFSRDGDFRLTRIDYSDSTDGPHEEFTYNGLGQVVTHRMTSGGVERFEYDNGANNRGMLTSYTPPATPSDPNPEQHPTRYYYYGNDRLWHVVDPYGNATWFEYNQRGQVTKVTHQDGTYVQSSYNDDGTLAWTADENHPGAASDPSQRTRYTYDDYKRVLSVTNPLSQTTSFSYAQDWANSYVQTTSNPKGSWSPMGKPTHFAYDPNWQRTILREAAGTADDAWTFYGYDAAGNLTSIQDPRGSTTTFGYDERNRKIWMDDPIGSDRNSSGHTMNWEYDGLGNTTKETRADNAFRGWDYDSMNRLCHAIDWRTSTSDPAITTTYGRDVTSTHETITDAKGAVYSYELDALHRKITATYPLDSYGLHRTETWHFDPVGNMDYYKAPVDLYKTIVYDSRNRPIESYWNASGTHVNTVYDAASRVTSITTNGGETTVAFGYDDANRQVSEEQTVAGYPTRRLTTHRNLDGARADLSISTGGVMVYGVLVYDYTQRGQLAHIAADALSNPWFNYTYDAAGNMTKRQDVYSGVNDSLNMPSQYYDALNRPTMCENTQIGDAAYARSWYQYDKGGREVATWRDEQSAKGERYWYNETNQLTNVRYNADQTWTGNPINPTRSVDYTYAPDRLNLDYVIANGVVTTYGYTAMNQYMWINGWGPLYDQNFNLYLLDGWRYDYNADKQLLLTTNGGSTGTFLYDGLGRCVKRTINGVTTLITYDDWRPTIEWDVNGNLSALNVYGAGPDEILYRYVASGGQRFRYHHDIHGNVTTLLDFWTSSVVEKYSYDAFGQPTITDWWDNPHYDANGRYASWYDNRFLFQGREYFPELGIYDYRNRMYHPGLGRFLQTDPTGFDAGDMNLFRYCGDDPINGSDPLGLDYDHDGRGDYDYDVRYNMMEDFAGLEAGNYIRDQFAQADAASQAFDAFSARQYQQSQQEQLSFGLISNSGPEIRRATPVHNIGVFYPQLNMLYIYFTNGKYFAFGAGNVTRNPGGNPFKGGIMSPFPAGVIWHVDHVERFTPESGQDWIDFGPAFFKIGDPGTIAYTRGTGLHAGTDSPFSITNGCVRITTNDMYSLLNYLDQSHLELQQFYAFRPGGH